MRNILLVEPKYKTKFPPLGLLKISSYHKSKNDNVTLIRGMDYKIRSFHWDRVYISSLFTYELKTTLKTIKYYSNCVDSQKDLFVGGIGSSLIPEFIQENIDCTLLSGLLDKPFLLDKDNDVPIESYMPDYEMLDMIGTYQPNNSYFCRASYGCIRKCDFCAVPKLEPNFIIKDDLRTQIIQIEKKYGKRKDLVLLDNNILACENFRKIIHDICLLGFSRGSKLNRSLRNVDFNQGIDARLIDKPISELLGSINLKPIRLAYDDSKMKKSYINAIRLLCNQGFTSFTNYLLFNHKDTPEDFYDRMRLNVELSDELNVRISGFPMKYVPISNLSRNNIGKHWNWRYLRGIQCILLATHGIVSPKKTFFEGAFGQTYNDFIEIISMPDHYIIYRERYKHNKALIWKEDFRKLSIKEKNELYDILFSLKEVKGKKPIDKYPSFISILEHYYPDGEKVKLS